MAANKPLSDFAVAKTARAQKAKEFKSGLNTGDWTQKGSNKNFSKKAPTVPTFKATTKSFFGVDLDKIEKIEEAVVPKPAPVAPKAPSTGMTWAQMAAKPAVVAQPKVVPVEQVIADTPEIEAPIKKPLDMTMSKRNWGDWEEEEDDEWGADDEEMPGVDCPEWEQE